MARSRNALHISKLEEFTNFCLADGWLMETPKGDYEILRMVKDGKQGPLLVHKSAVNKEHYTIHGHSYYMFFEFQKFQRGVV